MAKLMISCKEATQFILKKEEGKLTVMQRLQLWFHLVLCVFCTLFFKQNKILRHSASHLHAHTQATLSAAEKKALIDALQPDKNL
jgi:hypothetical protein